MLPFSPVSVLIRDSTAQPRIHGRAGEGPMWYEIQVTEHRNSLCLFLGHKLQGLVCTGLISNCPTIESQNIYSADKLIALMMIIITTITTVESLGKAFSVGISSIIT